MEQREYIVEAEGAGQRIDRFLSGDTETALPLVLLIATHWASVSHTCPSGVASAPWQ